MDKKSLGDIESAFAFFRETKSDEELSRQTVFLKYCGIERCLPGHGYGPAKRDCFLIHFILLPFMPNQLPIWMLGVR